jgi:photoactive yellow protein
MSDQDSPQNPDDRSILDPSGSEDADASNSEASSPSTDAADTPPDDSAQPAHDDGSSQDEPASQDAGDLHFDDDDLGERLRHASDETLDNAPFGVIKVDDEGSVEFFNQYEAELSGMDPDEVVGRNFFTQVAPCTNNRLFRGRFKKGVRRGELDETFTYTYTYKMRPTLVDVHLYRDEAGNNWITVQKY